MDIWQILNSKFTLLVVGFFLTTATGGLLTYFFQKRSWKRQAYLDLYKKKYDDGIKFLDELSELIGKRYFFMRKLTWAIAYNDIERTNQLEKQYSDIVFLWNSNYYKNRNKVRLLVTEELATLFLDYSDDGRLDKPISLHYKFVITHRKIMDAKKNIGNIQEAESHLENLNWSCSAFIEKVTSEFSNRAQKLQLLDDTILKDNFTRQ